MKYIPYIVCLLLLVTTYTKSQQSIKPLGTGENCRVFGEIIT